MAAVPTKVVIHKGTKEKVRVNLDDKLDAEWYEDPAPPEAVVAPAHPVRSRARVQTDETPPEGGNE